VEGIPARVAPYAERQKLTAWLDALVSACKIAEPDHHRAADWILDNDYQIRRAIRAIDTDLPETFYNRLDALGDKTGYPRIWALTRVLYGTIESELDSASLEEFFRDYQSVSELTVAELWAVPSMFRLVCLDELMRGTREFTQIVPAVKSVEAGSDRSQADSVAVISKAILVLTSAASFRWDIFVDAVSLIEAELRHDPQHSYPEMDLATRSSYRKAVEDLSEWSPLSQRKIANTAVSLAQDHALDRCCGHVGYWLIDNGRCDLEKAIGYRPALRAKVARTLKSHAGKTYIAAMLLALLAVCVLPAVYLMQHAAKASEWLITFAIVMLPASVLSVTVVHWITTRLSVPKRLPAMDFRAGVAKVCRTTILVPVILSSAREVEHIVERLEVQWLANRDPEFRVVLLSDLFDAPQEVTPEDEVIETELVDAIRQLNERHGIANDGPFILLHRNRSWNESSQCWMGWERKRGKLTQFNALALTGDAEPFRLMEGNYKSVIGSRFAIVLDADTDMTPASAAQMVAVMAHPLNRPQFDSRTGQVQRGYTILQPRVEILPTTGYGTYFSHWFSGDTAIDIYSRAVSDVYQDLFGTGIFVGKGIYDIAAVVRSMAGRVPENAILSHDLFEGALGRAGLASHIVVYEDFPENYRNYALRLHRWIRGDWQLLPWLFPKVPSEDGGKVKNRLPALDRWKILDNLRRSLIPPSLLLFFIAGWVALPGSAWIWTFLAAAAPSAYLFGEAVSVVTGGIGRGFLADTFHRLSVSGGRWFFSIVFLISDSLIALDAIIKTLWRVFVTKRNLLEWTSAAHVSAHPANKSDRIFVWKMMWPSSAVAFLLAVLFFAFDPSALPPATPVLLLWLLAPEIAYWGSKPRRLRQETLDEDQKHFLRLLARRTWYFFESFAGPDDNWLPPDNFQAVPRPKVAHRTSPTNIGMYLTSAMAAYDLGFISGNDLAVRCRNALDAMDSVEVHRGHLLNWYDTQTLQPLEPRYVSSVDSGNLAIALIALKQGLLETRLRAPVDARLWCGLSDTLNLLREAIAGSHDGLGGEILETVDEMRSLVESAERQPGLWLSTLDDLQLHWQSKLDEGLQHFLDFTDGLERGQLFEVQSWTERYHHHLRMMRRDLIHFYPWLKMLEETPAECTGLSSRLADSLLENGPDNWLAERTRVLDESSTGDSAESTTWIANLRRALNQSDKHLAQYQADLEEIAQRAHAKAYGMEFGFLYDEKLRLFHIGYNLMSGRLDTSHYDLLATEARLASFLAVAKRDVPVRHWFSFSRPITRIHGKPSILSWNGSMFEYLMPPLFLPSARDTLLGESEIAAVDYQRRYARQRNVPWGISESAFSATDAEGNYQYRAFGVPGLGIRRGLTDDLVISPYSSALALCVWPSSATANLQALRDLGGLTAYGFWEAFDYTPSRLAKYEAFAPVETYMAHHQGMVIGAILNVLRGDRLVRWVMADRRLQAAELILQERVPWEIPTEQGRIDEKWGHEEVLEQLEIPGPWKPLSNPFLKQFHTLGNGHLSCRFSPSGQNSVSLQGTVLLRSASPNSGGAATQDFIIRDVKTGKSWTLFD
ncbi:MAG: glucoamylase family protein, partial [Rhizobiaceae bacterium]